MINQGRNLIISILVILLSTSNIFAIGIDTLDNGVSAPNFTLYDIYNDSISVSLDNYTNKILLIDMMASWCVPCQISNPTLISLYNQIGDTGNFDILSVGIDLEDSIDDLKNYHEEYNLTWTMTKDNASAINDSQSFHSVYRYSEEYSYGVPLFYLISNGTIVWSEAGWWDNEHGSKSEIWMFGNITREYFELTGTQIYLEYTFDETSTFVSESQSSSEISTTSTTNLTFWWFVLTIPAYSKRKQ